LPPLRDVRPARPGARRRRLYPLPHAGKRRKPTPRLPHRTPNPHLFLPAPFIGSKCTSPTIPPIPHPTAFVLSSVKEDRHGSTGPVSGAPGLHADRAVGGDRHHRHPDRTAPPRRPEGPRSRRPHGVPEQPPPDRPGPAQLRGQ